MAIVPHFALPALAGAAALAALLTAAACKDIWEYRVPNAIVLCGIALALALHSFSPAGPGQFNAMPLGQGIAYALAGLAVGLGTLLPFYAMGGIAAGDVKLMAMVGAFLGPRETLGAWLLTALAGAVVATIYACRQRALRRALSNIRELLAGTLVKLRPARRHASLQTAVHVPYALAIAAGTGAWLALRQIITEGA